MTGKDIFKALGGLDPKIVLSAAPKDESVSAKGKVSSNEWIKEFLTVTFCELTISTPSVLYLH